MAKAKNRVLSGLYQDSIIFKSSAPISFSGDMFDFIQVGNLIVNESNLKNIEIIDKDTAKDNGSSLARGIVGGALLGGAGLVAGASMGKMDSINTLCITWKDEQKSLIEVDREIFKILNTIAWNVQNNIDNAAKYEKVEKWKKENKIKYIIGVSIVGFLLLLCLIIGS